VTAASRTITTGGTATASYSLLSSGDINTTLGSGGAADRGDWISPKIGMANYEARATVLTGSLSSGPTGSWSSLSGPVTWTRTASQGAGVQQATFTLEIRRALDAVVMDSATITISAESQ
jgi:hypothetical protein